MKDLWGVLRRRPGDGKRRWFPLRRGLCSRLVQGTSTLRRKLVCSMLGFKPGKAGDPVMRGPKPDLLNLSDFERTELKRLVRGHLTAQQVALRGRIILAADAGQNN